MLLVIDNYDSFTYNLVQYLGEMQVHGNDKISPHQVRPLKVNGGTTAGTLPRQRYIDSSGN